jgi:predicted RND superfamily exporter protein
VLAGAGSLAVLVLSVIGLGRIRVETDIIRSLRPTSALYQATAFIDSHLTGTNTLEFVVTRSDGASLVSHDAVRRMAAFEQSALRHPEVTSVGSILAVLRQLQRAESGGDALVPHWPRLRLRPTQAAPGRR